MQIFTLISKITIVLYSNQFLVVKMFEYDSFLAIFW